MPPIRLADPEYRNWVTVGQAIRITRSGLEAIVQNAVDKYHTSLFARLSNSTCAWKTYLTNAHRSRDKRKISWSNSDTSKWLTVGASWEIAKIFMAPLGPRKLDVVNAQTTDISGLLNVLEWSPRGFGGVFNTGVVALRIADARSARNSWAHAPSLHISDADKASAFAFFTSLLRDPELLLDKDVQTAINELGKLLKDGLAVIEEAELVSIVELQRQLGQDVVSLKSHVDGWQDQVEASFDQIQGLRKSLEEFVKKNELENVLNALVKKMNEMEDGLQSTNARLEKLEEKATAKPEYNIKSSLKFNAVSDRMKEEFVGREWLFTNIDSWLEKDLGPRDSCAFLLWGGPGTGKTSFANELVRRNDGEKLAAYHYCQNDNPRTCDLESLVLNLSQMLLESLPEYSSLIGCSPRSIAEKFKDQPEKLFDALITTPLQQLKENVKRFLIIDGLDEGDSVISSCFARLSATLPPWLRVILTARHDAPALTNLFPDSTFASLDHFRTNPQSSLSKDISEFIAMKYRKLFTEYPAVPSFFANNEKTAHEKIVEASQNCFLYAKLVMEHIFAGHDEIGLPTSLSEIYCLDFRRRFPDVDFFEKKVAPVLEVVLAIRRAEAKCCKYTLAENKLTSSHRDFVAELRVSLFLQPQRNSFHEKGFQMDKECVSGVFESGLLPGFSKRDLNKALKLLSGYLIRNGFNEYQFSHSSVSDWLQDQQSDFFCDAINGHSIMKTYNLQTLKLKLPETMSELCSNPRLPFGIGKLKSSFIRYHFHCSYLPLREGTFSPVNVLISELGIKPIDLFHLALKKSNDDPFHVAGSEFMAMKVLDETDVLTVMSLKQKVEHLPEAIRANCASLTAKLINSAYWVFSNDVIFSMLDPDVSNEVLRFVEEKGSLPQLCFSLICTDAIILRACSMFLEYCIEHGAGTDGCVPRFLKNIKKFTSSVCWNEDVAEYFRKLKSEENNVVITLESLKEKPFYIEEAHVGDFTLEIIQKPLSEVERLVRDGELVLCFKYAWHHFLKKYRGDSSVYMNDYLLKYVGNVNNRGYLGVTALMYACQQKDERLVVFLLWKGAKVNQQNFFGSTALHYVLKFGHGDHLSDVSIYIGNAEVRIIEMLLRHGANPNLKNSFGLSPIGLAKRRGRIELEQMMRNRGQS